MTISERRSKIIKLLGRQETLSVKDLSKEFHVSIPTLYKDLDSLEQEQLISKSYGEIRLIKEDKYKHDFFRQLKVEQDSKKNIAKMAVELISDGETIFLDASTTTYYLCRELKASKLRNLTIVTNSAFIPTELIMQEQFRIICIGGVLERASAEFTSSHPEQYLGTIHAQTYFFSVRAISAEKGVLDYYNPSNIRIKNLFLENADRAVCLVDSTKFNKPGTVNWVGFEQLKTVVTDKYVAPEIVSRLEEQGVTVLI
jgi:DeoR family transcriptional regulator, fructose operon transcriptional repressor